MRYDADKGDGTDCVACNARLQPAQCERIYVKGYQRPLKSLLRRDAPKLAKVFLARVKDCKSYTQRNNVDGTQFSLPWYRDLRYAMPWWYHNTEISPNRQLPLVAGDTIYRGALVVISHRCESCIN